MPYPTVQEQVPRLLPFIEQTAAAYARGDYAGWPAFVAACDGFYDDATMQQIEAQVPGWQRMASYAKQQTLYHVTAALVALTLLPEYQQATAEQQALLRWIVLLHDLDKRPAPAQRDHTHGFRGATVAADVLAHNGFAVRHKTAAYANWVQMTRAAEIQSAKHNAPVQDNRYLPQIIAGIDALCDAPAALIVKGVLLHMSVDVVADWPQAAALSHAEIAHYITLDLLPLLRAMTLVDSNAWALFEPSRKAAHRAETLAVWQRVAQQRRRN